MKSDIRYIAQQTTTMLMQRCRERVAENYSSEHLYALGQPDESDNFSNNYKNDLRTILKNGEHNNLDNNKTRQKTNDTEEISDEKSISDKVFQERSNGKLEYDTLLERDDAKAVFTPQKTSNCKMIMRKQTADILDDKQFEKVYEAAYALFPAMIDSVNTLSCLPLMFHAANGDAIEVSSLIDDGFDVDVQTDEGLTALMVASQSGHTNVISTLLRYKANVKMKCKSGKTALHYAKTDIIAKQLAKNGVEVEACDEKGNTALFSQSFNGNSDIVQFLLEKNAEVNFLNIKQQTSLMAAAQEGHLRIADLLISFGADINLRDANGWSAIMFAFVNDKAEVQELLRTHGGALDSNKDIYQGSPLINMALLGNIEKVEKIINFGADINYESGNGITPLMAACQNGHLKIAKLLIKEGADVNATTDKLCTAVTYASLHSHRDILQELRIAGADINHSNVDGISPICICSLNGKDDVVKDLISWDADVNSRDSFRNTPVMNAAQNGHLRIIKELFKHGANLHACNVKGINALFLAACNDHVPVVRWLVDNQADVTISGKYGESLLHIAASKESVQLLRMLCSAGLNVNCLDSDARTPLMVATQKGNLNSICCLIKYGAKITFSDKNGLTALSYAALNDHKHIVSFFLSKLLSSGIDNGMGLKYCTLKSDYLSVQRLIQVNTPLSLEDAQGITPVIAASSLGCCDIVRVLVENNANLHQVTRSKMTALSFATLTQHYKIVEFLIDQKAKVNIVDEKGNTPLLLSCKKNNFDIANLLLSHGADPNIADSGSLSPLMIACKVGSLNIAKLLVEKGARTDLKSKAGFDAVTYAYMNSHGDIESYLNEHKCFVSSEAKESMSEKLVSYAQSDSGISQALLDDEVHFAKELIFWGKMSLDYVDDNGMTTLMIAIGKNEMGIINSLLDKGVKLDQPGLNQITALTFAALTEKTEVVKLLGQKGANVGCKDNLGDSPLMLCALKGDEKMAELLIELGSNVNMQCQKQATPLMAAAQEGNLSMVKLLLLYGANCQQKNVNGLIARDYAQNNNKDRVMKLLDNFDKLETAKSMFFDGKTCEAINIIKECTDVNIVLKGKKSFLDEAVQLGNAEMVKCLLECGADVNSLYPRTPLNTAIKIKNTEIIRLLIENDAVIDFGIEETINAIEAISEDKGISEVIREYKMKEERYLNVCITSPMTVTKVTKTFAAEKPSVLSTPKDHSELKEIFRQFVKQMGREKIPQCIQHCTRSKKYRRIVVNIDKGSIPEAKEYTRKIILPDILKMIHFVEQPERPQPLMMRQICGDTTAGEGRDWLPKFDSYLGPGCLLSGAQRSEVIAAIQDQVPNVEDACRKHIFGPYTYGSLACFAKDDNNELYGITSKHIFDINTYGENKEAKMEIVDFSDIHVLTEVFVNTPRTEYIELFSDSMQAIYDNININGADKLIDVAILKVTQSTANSPHFRMHFTDKNRRPVRVEVCEMSDDDIIKNQVQKNGATTGFTEGKIVDADFEYNREGKLFGGVFVVVPDDHSKTIKFADRGDSGSLVTDRLKENNTNQAYGLCHRLQSRFIDEEEKEYDDALLCVRLNHCLQAVQKKLGKSVSLCNPQVAAPSNPINAAGNASRQLQSNQQNMQNPGPSNTSASNQQDTQNESLLDVNDITSPETNPQGTPNKTLRNGSNNGSNCRISTNVTDNCLKEHDVHAVLTNHAFHQTNTSSETSSDRHENSSIQEHTPSETSSDMIDNNPSHEHTSDTLSDMIDNRPSHGHTPSEASSIMIDNSPSHEHTTRETSPDMIDNSPIHVHTPNEISWDMIDNSPSHEHTTRETSSDMIDNSPSHELTPNEISLDMIDNSPSHVHTPSEASSDMIDNSPSHEHTPSEASSDMIDNSPSHEHTTSETSSDMIDNSPSQVHTPSDTSSDMIGNSPSHVHTPSDTSSDMIDNTPSHEYSPSETSSDMTDNSPNHENTQNETSDVRGNDHPSLTTESQPSAPTITEIFINEKTLHWSHSSS